MSRTGKLPVIIPSGVKASIAGHLVSIEGPKGKLTKSFNSAVTILLENNALVVHPKDASQFSRSMHGTARSILAAMVIGVTKPYSKDIEIQGTGFKGVLKGRILDLSLGYSHPILYNLPDGISVTLADGGTKIKVEGPDKHMVGQVAADIKHYYPVEPYKGKGVRIIGQFVRRKEGKKTA